MKKTLFTLAAAAMIFASCSTKQETAPEEQATIQVPTEIKDVEGRTNMGAKMYVTPQPALMIATYDANKVPAVMMAA